MRRFATALVATLALAGCGSGKPPAPLPPAPLPQAPPASFYASPPTAEAPPGTIARSLQLQSPGSYRLWAILYHSRSRTNADVIVSGLLAIPTAKAPSGGFPLVSYAHETVGFTDAAAPSRNGGQGEVGGLLGHLVPLGYAVVATDYEGLGVGGPPPYEVGLAAGHDVLDAARAAQHFPHIGAKFAAVGVSEGGHAVLWAAQLQPTYAPELQLTGVAAVSPGANLVGMFQQFSYTPFVQLNDLRVVGAWSRIYGFDDRSLLTAAGLQDAQLLMQDKPPSSFGQIWAKPPATSSALMALAKLNTPDGRAQAPILMLVGTLDTQVPPATNVSLAQALQKRGDFLRLVTLPGADHATAVIAGAQYLQAFLAHVLPSS
jgi:alpha-beta hydrolase superfamily lysophospholipase